jgi:glycosyltransferase involved in cell wall biosynthesis
VHQAARLKPAPIAVVINLPGPPDHRYQGDLKTADALVADGWAADRLPQMLGCDVARVPKGVDATLFSPDGADLRAQLSLQSKRVVIAVGRLVPIKNMALLLHALRLVRMRVRDAHLLIVGEGPEQSALANQTVAHGLRDAVTFAGFVPFDRLPAYYRTADAFALPSRFDNSPNAVLEAMASGLPIVATDVGGVAAFVERPAGGSLVPPDDPRALSEAVVEWLESPARRRAAATHNRRVVLDRYSWRASATRLLEVYEDVLRKRRAQH